LRGKAGGWLNATRVTLGFLELAAATKFLSNADLVWSWKLLTRDVVLAFWIPLFALAGFYLIGKLRMGEGPADEKEHVSVLRVLAASAMFALSIYLTAGLINSRPFGGWIDGWLPPLEYPGMPSIARSAPVQGTQTADHGFGWIHDLEQGRATAREKGSLVFVNYTGYTCTNCRYMEGAVFPLPQIAELLRKMTLVELYTDGGGPEHAKNSEDQVRRFGTAALPLYVVETADGKVLGTFASSTNDPGEFQRFLEQTIARAKTPTAPADKPSPVEAMVAQLALKATRLSDGKEEPVIVPGKLTLVNFWASWCAPCIVELKEFLVDAGRDLEARGGRFAIVAVEEDDEGAKKALELARGWKVSESSALRVRTPDQVDPRLQFDGDLPYTVLIAPNGEILWTKKQAVTREELTEKLRCDPAMKLARKC
jgi:thiol:disulfide interchange protein